MRIALAAARLHLLTAVSNPAVSTTRHVGLRESLDWSPGPVLVRIEVLHDPVSVVDPEEVWLRCRSIVRVTDQNRPTGVGVVDVRGEPFDGLADSARPSLPREPAVEIPSPCPRP